MKTPKTDFFSDLQHFVAKRLSKEDVECRKILNILHCLLSLVHFTSSDLFNNYSFNLWEEIELNPYLDGRTKNSIKQLA